MQMMDGSVLILHSTTKRKKKSIYESVRTCYQVLTVKVQLMNVCVTLLFFGGKP